MAVMDFKTYKKVNDDRMNYREMEDASIVSSYRNVGCGDGYRIYLKINNEKIEDATYTTTGCGFGLTALAFATEWVKGKKLDDAGAIKSEDIEALFEFPDRRKNYPQSAAEAMRKAISDFQNGTGVKPEDQVTATTALEKLRSQGHLKGEKLTQVVLERQDLSGVDLSGADLSHAYLIEANLSKANLRGAKLRGAFLSNSDLTGADLRETDLRWCKLSGAKLDGTDFSGARYDVGTRLDPDKVHLFTKMKKEGKKEVFLREEKSDA